MPKMSLPVPLLYACCLPVKGKSRAIICDVQRQSYQEIPLGLFEILSTQGGKSVDEIKKGYNNAYDDIIDEYFTFLLEKEFIFYTNTPEYFPKMDIKWAEPTKITNGIIDIGKNSMLSWEALFSQFSDLGCEHLQIRCFENKPLVYFKVMLDAVEKLRIVSFDIITRFNEDMDKESLVDFVVHYPRIFAITIYDAPENKHIQTGDFMGHIIYTTQNIDNQSHCGQISSFDFVVNVKSFTESQHHNTCLNRKISIDTEGNIKNCPSMAQSFGNIKDTTLQEALAHPDFKKYWNITKDQISVCKDCEFRHICTDCRAYLENPEDVYSKPLKCGYNPYTCEWEDWSTHPLKHKAIEYYGLKEIL